MTVAASHGIPVDAFRFDLRSPAPLQGLVDAEHQWPTRMRLAFSEDQAARLRTWWYFAKSQRFARPITLRAEVMVRFLGARIAPTSSTITLFQVGLVNRHAKGVTTFRIAGGKGIIADLSERKDQPTSSLRKLCKVELR